MFKRIRKVSQSFTSSEKAQAKAVVTASAPNHPESPRLLENPFATSSRLPQRETPISVPPNPHPGNGPRRLSLIVRDHLVCDLPDIFVVPPGGDQLDVSVCVWNSKFDGRLASFLDSNPSTPEHEGQTDWIALAVAMKEVGDQQKGIPLFRRPSEEEVSSSKVIMPVASTRSSSIISSATPSDSTKQTNDVAQACKRRNMLVRFASGTLPEGKLTRSKSDTRFKDDKFFVSKQDSRPRFDSAPSILKSLPIPSLSRTNSPPTPKAAAKKPQAPFGLLAPPRIHGEERGVPMFKAKLPPPTPKADSSSSGLPIHYSPPSPHPPITIADDTEDHPEGARLQRSRAIARSRPHPRTAEANQIGSPEPHQSARSSKSSVEGQAVNMDKTLPTTPDPPQLPELSFQPLSFPTPKPKSAFRPHYRLPSGEGFPTGDGIEGRRWTNGAFEQMKRDGWFDEAASEVTKDEHFTPPGSPQCETSEQKQLRLALEDYKFNCPPSDAQLLRLRRQFNPLPVSKESGRILPLEVIGVSPRSAATVPKSSATPVPTDNPAPANHPMLPEMRFDYADASEFRLTFKPPVFDSEESDESPKYFATDDEYSEEEEQWEERDVGEEESGMRMLPPPSPLLPALDFDPYACAGDFKSYKETKTQA